jgi:hypothetical protein
MERIMSKTHYTSNLGYGAPKDPAALKEHRTLDDAELEAVTGGFFGGLGNDVLDTVKAKTARVSGVATSEVFELNT